MEPLSALGIAAAGVQFVDFATKLLSNSVEIYQSSLGQTERASLLSTVTSTLTSLTNEVDKKAAALRENAPPESADAIFFDTCRQCKEVSKELAGILAKLTARTSPKFGARSVRSSLAGGIRWAVSEGKIKDLDARLQSIQQQMQMAAIICLWEKARQNGETTQHVSQRLADVVATLERVDTSVKDTAAYLRDVVTKDSARTMAFGRRSALIEAFLSSKWPLHPTHDSPVDAHFSRMAQLVLLESLAFKTIYDREGAIPKAYAKTLEWLFNAQQDGSQSPPWSSFPAWLEKDTQEIYWITGKPGAGKSTLMKFLAGDPRLRQHLGEWAGTDDLTVATFFSWNAGTDLQKSHEGLLRSLLLQCMQQRPDLAPRVCPRRWACLQMLGLESKWEFPNWEWAELVDCFTALVSEAGKGYRLALFIDGLDEFDRDHTKLVDIVKDLSQQEGVKICVSSRPWNIFNDAFQRSPSLMVQHLTRNDIQRYVKGHFEGLPAFTQLESGDPGTAAALLQSIASRADGVFLWVTVVVRALTARLTAGDSLAELSATLNELPRDIEKLFNAIRRQIDARYLAQSSRYFLLLESHRMSLIGSNLSATTLLLADEDEGSTIHGDFAKICATRRSWMVDTMRRRLHSRTMGLLEISPDETVQFMHRTVVEWLNRSENIAKIRRDAPADFNPHLELCKARTTELLHFRLHPPSGPLDGIHQMKRQVMNLTPKFLALLTLCFQHAAFASSHRAKDNYRVVRTLDKLNIQLPRLLKTDALGNKFPAYLVLDHDPLLDEEDLESSDFLEHLTLVINWKPWPIYFVRLAVRFGVLPYVMARVDKAFLRRGGVRFHRLLTDAVFGCFNLERPYPHDNPRSAMSIWGSFCIDPMSSVRTTRVDVVGHLLRVSPQNSAKRMAMKQAKHLAVECLRGEYSVDSRGKEFLADVVGLLHRELSIPMWLWRSLVKGPKRLPKGRTTEAGLLRQEPRRIEHGLPPRE